MDGFEISMLAVFAVQRKPVTDHEGGVGSPARHLTLGDEVVFSIGARTFAETDGGFRRHRPAAAFTPYQHDKQLAQGVAICQQAQ